jgi:hypothetical protein
MMVFLPRPPFCQLTLQYAFMIIYPLGVEPSMWVFMDAHPVEINDMAMVFPL